MMPILRMQPLLEAYLGFVCLVFLFLIALDVSGVARRETDSWNTRKGYAPKTLVIIPCRGEEPMLYENFIAAKTQSYRNYKLLAVVDRNDGAYGIARKAGVACLQPSTRFKRCSDKVRRIASAIVAFRGYDVYVILDSDEKVGERWLEELLAPLSDARVGISVMFPVFKPTDRGFWSRIKQVWGFVGQSLLESRRTRFAAGGSMAFRKDLLDSGSFRFFTSSKYSISDDITLNLIVRKKGLEVAYNADMHPITYVRENAATLFEWANRQTALSIFANRKILYYGVCYYSAEILVLLTGIVGTFAVSPLLLLLLLHAASSVMKNVSRTGEPSAGLVLISLIMPFFYLSNLLVASTMRSITWRGIRYSLR